MASLESRLAVGGRRTLRWTSQSDSEEEEDDASSKQSFEERDDEAATIAEGSGWASDGPGKRWDLVDSEDDATAGMTRDGTMSGAATRRAAARFSGAQGGLADDAAAFHSVRSTEVARGASATAITAALVAGAEAAGLSVEARRAGYVCASGVVKGAHARAELQLWTRPRRRAWTRPRRRGWTPRRRLAWTRRRPTASTRRRRTRRATWSRATSTTASRPRGRRARASGRRSSATSPRGSRRGR